MTAPESSSLAWIADVALRADGWVVAMDVECWVDESGTHAGSPVICMAGYIVEKSQARELEREWNAVLNWAALEHPLPHFHMSDCAPDPGNGAFSGISKSHRKEVVSRLIGVIKRRTILGLAATVAANEYREILAGNPLYPDPYVLTAHMILNGVRTWINKQAASTRRVAYFFEAGHRASQDADAMIKLLFMNPSLKEQCRYAGHAFVPKLGNPMVQAADLLAWQWLKDRKNIAEGRKRRADLASLLIHPHGTTHMTPDLLRRIDQGRDAAIQALSDLNQTYLETKGKRRV